MNRSLIKINEIFLQRSSLFFSHFHMYSRVRVTYTDMYNVYMHACIFVYMHSESSSGFHSHAHPYSRPRSGSGRSGLVWFGFGLGLSPNEKWGNERERP